MDLTVVPFKVNPLFDTLLFFKYRATTLRLTKQPHPHAERYMDILLKKYPTWSIVREILTLLSLKELCQYLLHVRGLWALCNSTNTRLPTRWSNSAEFS